MIGVIALCQQQSYQPDAYHADDQQLLEQLAASRLATRVENVCLFAGRNAWQSLMI